MPGKILGLDIHTNSLTAVQVTSGLKGYQITACAHIPFTEGRDLDEVLTELTQKLDLKSDLCVSSIPAEDISFRNFSLPFHDRKKIRQTLPFELEPLVPFPLSELVVDFQFSTKNERSEILALSARKNVIADYLSRLQSHEIDPEVIEVQTAPLVSWLMNKDETPENGLLLYLGFSRSTLSLFLNNRVILMRTFGHRKLDGAYPAETDEKSPAEAIGPEQVEAWVKDLCTEVSKTIHACRWQQKLTDLPEKVFFTGPGGVHNGMPELLTRYLNLPAEPLNLSRDNSIGMDASISRIWNPALMDTALALALRDGRKGARFNLRRDEFEIQKPYLGVKKEIRRLGLLLGFVLAFLIADLTVDYYLLKERYLGIKGRVEAVFREALPNEPYTEDAAARIERKIEDIKNGSGSIPGIQTNQRVLDLILDISDRIPKGVDVRITRMVIDPEIIRISGITDNFNAVDTIKNGLEPSTYFQEVTISSANLEKTGKQVKFELKLQRAE